MLDLTTVDLDTLVLLDAFLDLLGCSFPSDFKLTQEECLWIREKLCEAQTICLQGGKNLVDVLDHYAATKHSRKAMNGKHQTKTMEIETPELSEAIPATFTTAWVAKGTPVSNQEVRQ